MNDWHERKVAESPALRITDKRVMEAFSGPVPDIGGLWELCVYLEWDRLKATDGIAAWLGEPGAARILDAACGSGFPGIDLAARGYDIVCSDGSASMLDRFRRNAALTGSLVQPVQTRWQDLADRFGAGSFDIVMCRGGGSLLYAGTWDEDATPDRGAMAAAVAEFVTCLRPGGRFYVDITRADNLSRLEPQFSHHPPMVIGDDLVELDEVVRTDPRRRLRTWQCRLRVNGQAYEFERRSHHVYHDELAQILEGSGLTDVHHEQVVGESYAVFTGRRPGA